MVETEYTPFLIIGIITLIVCVGLSGCEQNGNSNNTQSESVEFSNYTVTTEWEYFTNREGFIRTVKDGFYHEHPTDTAIYYHVRGMVKNIDTRPIDIVTITARFLDSNKNFLDSSSANVFNLYLGESKSFDIKAHNIGELDITPDYCAYFDHVEDFEIEYSITFH